jgi:1-acyl-sn-glycerol-3-phosphate acyltransferase
VKRIPFVGNIAEICGCLFINRSSKDEKRDMFSQLKERGTQIE